MLRGRASLGPTERRTHSTRETPAMKKVGQKMRKNKGKETKHCIVTQNG